MMACSRVRTNTVAISFAAPRMCVQVCSAAEPASWPLGTYRVAAYHTPKS